MSEFHHQQALPPTSIDVSASGSLSGRDACNTLDAAHHYHELNYCAFLHPLEIPQDGYAHDQFAYVSHSSGVSLPDVHFTLPIMAGHAIPQQYEHEPFNLGELNGFSPITPNFNINTYRTPYPDSNATSTSSATSPDPTNLMTDSVIIEADEDKRKRNQAASARFRQKKKQREQHLVETTREMQERTKKLEQENDGLKKENLFLKKLLVEKVDHMSDEDREMLKKVTDATLSQKK